MTAAGEPSDSHRPPRRSGLARRLFAVIVAVAVLLALSFTAALRRARVSASACAASCHQENLHPEARRGHETVACQTCHDTPAPVALGLWTRSFTGPLSGLGPHAAVDPGACATCHRQLSSWSELAATTGHLQHAGTGELSCLSCHAASTHGSAALDRVCLECHAEERLHPKREDAESCLSCHDFAVRVAGERGPTNPCLVCHGPESPQAMRKSGAARTAGADLLHGSVDCRLCHQPHHGMRRPEDLPSGVVVVSGLVPATDRADDTGEGLNDAAAEVTPEVAQAAPRGVAARLCHECHEIQFGAELESTPTGHRACEGCHRQHQPRRRALETCRDCHEQATPSSQGKSEALQHDSCTSCHVPHDWAAERSACVRCHVDKATSLLTRSPAEHNACTQCHAVHGPLPTGERCTACHTEKAEHVRVAPPRHRHCASCHDPHAASELPREVCASCHKREVGQLATLGPGQHAQNGCASCHTPHGAPLPNAKVCASCHRDQGKLVSDARPNEHHECGSCHAPHRFQIASVSAVCSRCHQEGSARAEAHRGECDTCHAPHGSPLVATAQCRDCHRQITATRARPGRHHGECATCHQPHSAAKTAVTQCQKCHQDQQRVATSWPTESPHGGRCNECHQPHHPDRRPQCAACHQDQSRAAVGGKHQCVQCHAPHERSASSPAGWWQRCASCHQKQTQAAASSDAATHRTCSNCHRPHAFRPPACSSCHAANSLKAGHRIAEHVDCRQCHSTHEASKPKRAQCLTCHRDRADHHPEAPRCVACHAFR